MTAQEEGKNAVEWPIGETILADFMVERLLGEGGMGKVYLLKSKTTRMRFAVKRAKGLKEVDRRNFLTELQTWIDLPEHPNLVPCRFFRTVGDELLIFAEYVDGGSLKDWIDSGKLYEGGKDKALARILDTAIQFAWGLHCVHELGVVHQDVKPANLMMSSDSRVAVQGLKAKVSDFGLARARAVAGERHVRKEQGQSNLVSSGGYTPAYCSPEQVSGGMVDRRTDVWSWGISVMEMFQGGVTWQSGQVALEALEAFLEHSGEEENIPAMPKELADVLKNCFHQDPARRYQKLDILVDWLPSLYSAKVDMEYPRTLVKVERQTTPREVEEERRASGGQKWIDPLEWLKQALQEDRRDPNEAERMIARSASSRRGQLVADIAGYEEARRIIERLVREGRSDLSVNLARLYCNAAILHEAADDSFGARHLYSSAIEVIDHEITVNGRGDMIEVLANIYDQWASFHVKHGDNERAGTLFEMARSVRESKNDEASNATNATGRLDTFYHYINHGVLQKNQGNHEAAIAMYKKAASILEEGLSTKESDFHNTSLAACYSNIATSLAALKNNHAAAVLFKRAISIRSGLVDKYGRSEHGRYLALSCLNLAVSLGEEREYISARKQLQRATELLEELVLNEKRIEFSEDLATCYSNVGNNLADMRMPQESLIFYEKALSIRDRLVTLEGRHDLAAGLAVAYMNLGNAHTRLGNIQYSGVMYDRCIHIYERLIADEGATGLTSKLSLAYLNKGHCLAESANDRELAISCYDKGIAFLEGKADHSSREIISLGIAKLSIFKAISLDRLNKKEEACQCYEIANATLMRCLGAHSAEAQMLLSEINEHRGGALRSAGINKVN